MSCYMQYTDLISEEANKGIDFLKIPVCLQNISYERCRIVAVVENSQLKQYSMKENLHGILF